MVFYNENGTPYIPLNFRGEWKGQVLLWEALANSMNVPSLRVLDSIGFSAAIDRAALLLGITTPDEIRENFPRVYPLGLGIISVSPLKMAKAFATFANEGREVTPIAIRAVEDRNGKVVLDPERELRIAQRQKGDAFQIISPQNAYIMTSILRKTVDSGTLSAPSGWGAKFTFRDEQGNKFKMPAAGKTGTPQNWSDAWTIGYTPYYTAAVWFGFDRPGNSLGVNLTGSTLAGPVWADFMRDIHQGLPPRDFVRPAAGLIDAKVCTKTGLLWTPGCPGDITLPFLEGTQPKQLCDQHQTSVSSSSGPGATLRPVLFDTMSIDLETELDQIRKVELDLDALPVRPGSESAENNSGAIPNRNRGRNQIQNQEHGIELPDYNPLLE
jgi:penicillin-binding protein 1A